MVVLMIFQINTFYVVIIYPATSKLGIPIKKIDTGVIFNIKVYIV